VVVLKDENIIAMMYDDIAYNEQNPRPSVIMNKPDGPNVYLGVPKVRMHLNFFIFMSHLFSIYSLYIKLNVY